MFCSKCGGEVANAAAFCPTCGHPQQTETPPASRGIPLAPSGFTSSSASASGEAALPAQGAVGAFPPPPTNASVAGVRNVAYAGFWLRLVAFIIDVIILDIASSFIVLPFMAASGLRSIMMGGAPPDNPAVLFAMMGSIFKLVLLSTAIQWLYFALLESSPWQGTIGKKALGLYVTDMQGRRISFARATGRYFGKIISSLILMIGYIMAGFTEKKQALHDMMAGCLVLRKI